MNTNFIETNELVRTEAAPGGREGLAAELEAMKCLHELVARLLVCPDLHTALEEVLVATIAITDAEMGNVQLFDPANNKLEIVAQRGFNQEFLDFFGTVCSDDNSACSRAMQARQRIVIEDVKTDPLYQPLLEIAAVAGYRAVQSTPLISRDGELLGMLSTHYKKPHRPSEQDLRILDLYARQAADFIERIRSGEAMRQLNAVLEQQAEQLREQDRHKDEFLGLLGHELRNPLAAITHTVELLCLDTLSFAERRSQVELIGRQAKHMLRLVDDLLDITRINRSHVELRKALLNLTDNVMEIVNQIRPQIEAHHHRLELDLPEQPLYVEADPARLTQMVLNLLNNAIHYTKEGGRITLMVQRAADQAIIRVRDTGIGIAADQLPQLFEPFRRLESAAGHHQGGLGLGLALARKLAQLHGGSLDGYSVGLDQGSEFTLRLPALPEDRAAEPVLLPVDSEAMIPTRRILLIEDDAAAGEALAKLLQLLGQEARLISRGEQAPATVREFHPELVLLDIGLPDMNGYEVARQLRREYGADAFRLVALTGYGQDEDLKQAETAGFDQHLLKPTNMQELQTILREL